jgi:hypothetical protein
MLRILGITVEAVLLFLLAALVFARPWALLVILIGVNIYIFTRKDK